MSMLAEPKRKQKWHLNPRGKEWSEDTNKFGQKMLEKMGWKSGKGLGANLDGMTDHIKPSYKHDYKGMGYKEREDQWTEHDKKFSELLKSLGENAAVRSNITPKALEEISATCKKRVHYQKLTRSKDISQYTEKQLANIFGKKTLKPKESDEDDNKNDCISFEGENEGIQKFGVDTVEGGSMVDYFKNKICGKFGSTGINKSGFEIGDNGVLKIVEPRKENMDCESEGELERPSFGFGFENNSKCTIQNENVENLSKKNKKRKFNEEILDNVYDNTVFNNSLNDGEKNPQGNIEENPYEVKLKKKKRKKSKRRDIDSIIDTSNVSDALIEKVKIKKKKKNKVTPINEKETGIIQTGTKKKKFKEINPNDQNLSKTNITYSESTLISDILDSTSKKNESSNNNSTTNEIKPLETLKKQKNVGLENPNFAALNDSGISFSEGNTEFEVTRKRKKDKKKKSIFTNGLDNPGLNVSTISNKTRDDYAGASYRKELSTSVQENHLFQGIENLALNISANDSLVAGSADIIECDLILNVSGLQTKQIEPRKSVRFSGMNQEFIIPNNYENKLMEQKLNGLTNAAFDERLTTLDENMLDIEHHLSTDCAKVENDLNEVRAAAHARLLVPIVQSSGNICHGNAGVRSLPDNKMAKEQKSKEGKPEGQQDLPEIGEKDSLETNIMTSNGDIRLSYKLASMKVSNLPAYLRKLPKNPAMSSYKHLIKGDIILGFRKSNLHKIAGYGSNQNLAKDAEAV